MYYFIFVYHSFFRGVWQYSRYTILVSLTLNIYRRQSFCEGVWCMVGLNWGYCGGSILREPLGHNLYFYFTIILWCKIYFFWWRKLGWFVVVFYQCWVEKNLVLVYNMVFSIQLFCFIFYFYFYYFKYLWTVVSSAFFWCGNTPGHSFIVIIQQYW